MGSWGTGTQIPTWPMKMDHSLGSREYGLDVNMVLERKKRKTGSEERKEKLKKFQEN